MSDGWQPATIVRVVQETPTVRSLVLRPTRAVSFLAGQHVDVRLTAPDGYTAVRSYSLTSAPEQVDTIELAIERLRDGEVSPWFHDVAAPGDMVDIRGPFTRHFVWEPATDGAALLIGGGSGIAPFLSMMRHRAAIALGAPALLLYSARTWNDVIAREELLQQEREQKGFQLRITLTRGNIADGASARAADYARRVDADMLRQAIDAMPVSPARYYVCGNNGFVGTVADALVGMSIDPLGIRTERYGE